MSVIERLVSYHANRCISSSDPRWEDVLADLRAGYVVLDRVPGHVMFGYIRFPRPIHWIKQRRRKASVKNGAPVDSKKKRKPQ
jgi:hypothetical protein